MLVNLFLIERYLFHFQTFFPSMFKNYKKIVYIVIRGMCKNTIFCYSLWHIITAIVNSSVIGRLGKEVLSCCGFETL